VPDIGLPYEFAEPVSTPRLRLRPVTADDVDDVYAYQSRPEVCRYLLFEPRTREQVLEKVSEYSTALVLSGNGDFRRSVQASGDAAGGSLRRGSLVQGRVGGYRDLRDPRPRVGRPQPLIHRNPSFSYRRRA
jgi:ribosomal protein S18 acetylase RimI-like enzyme